MKYRWYRVRFRLNNGNGIDVIAGGVCKPNAISTAVWILRINHKIQSTAVRSARAVWLRRGVSPL